MDGSVKKTLNCTTSEYLFPVLDLILKRQLKLIKKKSFGKSDRYIWYDVAPSSIALIPYSITREKVEFYCFDLACFVYIQTAGLIFSKLSIHFQENNSEIFLLKIH